MTEVTQTAAAMTQAIINVPYLLVPRDPEQGLRPNGMIDLGEDFGVHMDAMHLAIEARRLERAEVAPENRAHWNQTWEFTAARQQHVQLQYPRAIRALACTVMRRHNRRRTNEFGRWSDPALQAETPMTTVGELLKGREAEPLRIVRYLRRAGYLQDIPPKAAATATFLAPNRICPADARDYLDAHPAPLPPQAGECNRPQLIEKWKIGDALITHYSRTRRIYPAVRQPEGHGNAQEIEFFDREGTAALEAAFAEIRPPGKDEQLAAELMTLYPSRLFEDALKAANMEPHFRRARNSNVARALVGPQITRMHKIMAALTTLQPGEKGSEEIAEALGLKISFVRSYIQPSDVLSARKLYQTGRRRWRYVFPPQQATVIESRLRIPRLPPYLISEAGIVAHFKPVGSNLTRDKLYGITYDNSDMDTEIALYRSNLSRPPRCRSWSALQSMERRQRPTSEAAPIKWRDIPYRRTDLDPAKIEYARWVQSKLVRPEHVDDMPIEDWIAMVQAEIATGDDTEAANAIPQASRTRAKQPVRSSYGLVLPSEAIILASQPPAELAATLPPDTITPLLAAAEAAALEAQTTDQQPSTRPATITGAQPPSAPARPPSTAKPKLITGRPASTLPRLHAYRPPVYGLRVPLREAGRITGDERGEARLRLSAHDLAKATGAGLPEINKIVDSHRNSYATPARESRQKVSTEVYEGPLLDAVVIDLVGLTAAQMSARCHAPEAHITRLLNSTSIRPNNDGRYSAGVWKYVRAHFQAAPPHWEPLNRLPQIYTQQRWQQLAHNIGVQIKEYYTLSGFRMQHVGPSGAALLRAQLTKVDDQGRPHQRPAANWGNRFSLAEATGTSPAQVDSWMAAHVSTSSQVEWCRVSIANMPDIKLLPHFDSRLSYRYIAETRNRR